LGIPIPPLSRVSHDLGESIVEIDLTAGRDRSLELGVRKLPRRFGNFVPPRKSAAKRYRKGRGGRTKRWVDQQLSLIRSRLPFEMPPVIDLTVQDGSGGVIGVTQNLLDEFAIYLLGEQVADAPTASDSGRLHICRSYQRHTTESLEWVEISEHWEYLAWCRQWSRIRLNKCRCGVIVTRRVSANAGCASCDNNIDPFRSCPDYRRGCPSVTPRTKFRGGREVEDRNFFHHAVDCQACPGGAVYERLGY